ncbi:MAG: hypothetical protein HYU66_01315 [Armatimonadetes bacterium]|nr:hypothetical protein [Armatimonadota bacterium]
MSALVEGTASAFEEMADVMLRLQDLHGQGKTDTDEAEEVRCVGDDAWYRLSTEEKRRADGLSSDLLMLSGEETLSTRDTVPMSPEQWRAEYLGARENGDHWRVLELLRHPARSIDEKQVALARGIVYFRLGLAQAASAFFVHAWRLSHDPDGRLVMAALFLLEDRWEEALELAQEVLQDRADDATSLLAAGLVLLRATHEERPNTPPDALQTALRLFERALAQLQADPEVQPQADLERFARTGLAACHLLLFRQYGGADIDGLRIADAVPDAAGELIRSIDDQARELIPLAA